MISDNTPGSLLVNSVNPMLDVREYAAQKEIDEQHSCEVLLSVCGSFLKHLVHFVNLI
jgi:hypothetical protein